MQLQPERSSRCRRAASALDLLDGIASVDGPQQPIEGLGEKPYAVIEKLHGHVMHGDAELRERLHRAVRFFDILGQAQTRTAMVAECVEGRPAAAC